MQLPIIIEGEQAGVLGLCRQGRGFRAEVKMKDIGRVARLSVYGKGSVYLGIPEPREGVMTLSKTLPALPPEPRYCAERPVEREPAAPAAKEEPPERKRHRIWRGGKPYYF